MPLRLRGTTDELVRPFEVHRRHLNTFAQVRELRRFHLDDL